MLQVGSVIEILQADGNRLTLRRVRVAELNARERSYRIAGVNLKGKNSVNYTLPLHPINTLAERTTSTAWSFSPTGPSEE